MTIINTGVYMHLYHYAHCPFCVRVRMVAGFLNLSYNSQILPYNEEDLPIKLTGKKMLPILTLDGENINESLEIIQKLDINNKLKSVEVISEYTDKIEPILNALGSDVHSLAMPYWMWTPEFDDSSREYFQSKKEAKRGPFKELVRNKEKFISSLEEKLQANRSLFQKDLSSQKLDLKDILIAAHLWGMYIVPEFQFNTEIHNFLQEVGKQSNFNYHEDFWK